MMPPGTRMAGKLGEQRVLTLWHGMTPQELMRLNRSPNWPHAHPSSVFVANIGAMYEPGCYQRAVDMVMHTQGQGLQCWYEEMSPQRGGPVPFVDSSYMRDQAVLRALDGGFEYVCLLDGDTEPEPDTLVKLMAHNLPIVAPYIIEPGVGEVIGDPRPKQHTGLRPMRWVCFSMLVFRTSVFNIPGAAFMFNGGGAADSVFFQRLWHFGHRPYMDTDVELKVTRPPGRLGALSWDERWDYVKGRYESSQELPDRRAIDPNDPAIVDGVYAPFLKRNGGSSNGDKAGV